MGVVSEWNGSALAGELQELRSSFRSSLSSETETLLAPLNPVQFKLNPGHPYM
jgi:hypothetical protein